MVTHRQVLLGSTLEQCTYQPTKQPSRYLFRETDTKRIFAVDEPTVFKNLLMLGGAGSGKSNVINQVVAQTQLWAQKSSEKALSVIFDTKGDYIRHPGFFHPGDLIIANGGEYRGRSAVWNLFEDVLADGDEKENYEPNAREIAAVYFSDRGSQSQPFFANAARDIFASAIIYFIRRRQDNPTQWRDKLNNEFLKRFLLYHSAKDLVRYFTHYPDLRGIASYLGDGTSNQALGVMAELHSMLYECFQGSFAAKAAPGQPSFSIRRVVREKQVRSIFIMYDLSQGETLAPVYKLLIDLALKEALSAHANGRVHLFLDELKLLPNLRHLEDALNFGRSKKVGIVAGLQSVDQLFTAYGDHVGRDILAGFGSVFAFHLNDAASREYITALYGQNLVAYRYENAGGQTLDREREGHTVEDWDMMALGPGQAVVSLASQAFPFRFSFEKDPALGG